MMFSSPVLLEDDHFFSMSQGQHHFLLGHEISDHDQLALLDNHDFVDVMMVAGNFEMERVAPDQKKQTKAIGGSSIDDYKPVKRIRAGKKDRHSKIYTAQGPRDRRMRLSLEIARKFFDLQDKLGFDKASNTIEWLFNMSKTAIKEVMGSRMDEPHGDQFGGNDNISCEDGRKDNLKKDVRDKARARARERTLEKMRLGALKKDPTQGLFLTLEKAAAAAKNPSNHSCLQQIEHEDPGAIAQSVEELIHTDWEIYNATFFSSYDFDDTTPELQHVLTTGINHVLI